MCDDLISRELLIDPHLNHNDAICYNIITDNAYGIGLSIYWNKWESCIAFYISSIVREPKSAYGNAQVDPQSQGQSHVSRSLKFALKLHFEMYLGQSTKTYAFS